MGGNAFAQAFASGQPTLRTPRMTPEEYKRLRDTSRDRIQACLPNSTVAALIEAPEKQDYGDIDLVIATEEDVTLADLAQPLRAAGIILHSSKKASFGIRKCDYGEQSPTVEYRHWHGKGVPAAISLTQEGYAQLDVEVIRPELLDWYAFYSSYGDLAGLIGHIVTQLGFTVSDTGFWLRLPELDASKTIPGALVADCDGFIFLSHDPRKVIEFLGCSCEQYESGFKTLDQLYEWLGACRLLSPEAIQIKRNNSHERNREQRRSVYSRFFNEWLPARMDDIECKEGKDNSDMIKQLREKHLQEAVDFFAVRTNFERKEAAIVVAVNNALATNLIKPLIAEHSEREGKHLSEIVRAFRRHVTFDSFRRPHVIAKAHADVESEVHKFLDADKRSLYDANGTSEWIKLHWLELRTLIRQRGKEV